MIRFLIVGILWASPLLAEEMPALNWGELKVGQAGEHQLVMQPRKGGSSRQANLRVVQVLGPREMLVRASVLDFTIGAARSTDSERSVDVIVRTSTEGLVDDRPWDPEGRCFRVAETTTYETAIGAARTVFVLEEVKRTELLAQIRDEKWPARWASERQSWRTRDGVIVDAVYDGLQSGTVALRRGDRTSFTLKLTELDEKSRRLALRLAKEAGDRK